MIRFRSLRRSAETLHRTVDAAMTPMIDVVFLLLVFFVCTASFRLIEFLLPASLAPPAGGEETRQPPVDQRDDFERVVLRIAWSEDHPQWRVNDQLLADEGTVRETLQRLAAIQPDAQVIVHPEADVPVAWVVKGWDWARLAGFRSVGFAIEPGRAAAN